MINWSEKFETKYPVIDLTIKENWDLVKEYVKRAYTIFVWSFC